MDINTGGWNNAILVIEVKTVEAKDSPDSPPADEDRAEVVSTAEDKSSPVIAAEDNMPVRKAVLARKDAVRILLLII